MKLYIVALSLILCATGIAAQAPPRVEQLVYNVLAFTGRDYAGTVARESSEAIYLLANADNFVTAHKTFVYFWPLTQEWRVEPNTLDIEVEGTLELLGTDDDPQKLERLAFTFYYVQGEYEVNWRVAKGPDAKKIYDYYRNREYEYRDARDEYFKVQTDFEGRKDELTTRIMEMRRDKQDPAELIAELTSMQPPVEPSKPNDFIVPPRNPEFAHVINLPPGEYGIRLVTPDGFIVEGSQKRLMVFERRRSSSAGFEVIPADKWTRPEVSSVPRSVLYVDGSVDIYLRPFYQDEYNDLHYAKLGKNDARGNSNITRWVRLQQIPRAVVELRRSSEILTVHEKPFVVQQVPGAALGYNILPYEPDTEDSPNLRAHLISLEPTDKYIKIRVIDDSAELIPGSRRTIRVIPRRRAPVYLLVIAFIPLAAMVLALTLRREHINRRSV